jgi:hypothetical protein
MEANKVAEGFFARVVEGTLLASVQLYRFTL